MYDFLLNVTCVYIYSLLTFFPLISFLFLHLLVYTFINYFVYFSSSIWCHFLLQGVIKFSLFYFIFKRVSKWRVILSICIHRYSSPFSFLLQILVGLNVLERLSEPSSNERRSVCLSASHILVFFFQILSLSPESLSQSSLSVNLSFCQSLSVNLFFFLSFFLSFFHPLSLSLSVNLSFVLDRFLSVTVVAFPIYLSFIFSFCKVSIFSAVPRSWVKRCQVCKDKKLFFPSEVCTNEKPVGVGPNIFSWTWSFKFMLPSFYARQLA